MDSFERSEKESAPALADAIEKIMANPELISAVASALGKAPPPSKEPKAADPIPQSESETVSATPQSQPDLSSALSLLPLLSGLQNGGPKPPDNDRTRLLCALKPYVNPHRRDTIDTLLRFSGMSELLKLLHPHE